MSGKFVNKQNDAWFLSKVSEGVLVVKKSGKILNTLTNNYIGALGSGGYYKISMKDFDINKIRNMQVHRLVFLVHKGKIPKGYEVDHEDENRSNNAASNLQAITRSNNSSRSKPSQAGSKNPFSKLTEEDVRAIRRLYKKGVSQKRLSAQYDVTKVSIHCIVKNKTWTHVK